MQPGKIWVANRDGVYLIRMVGNVRLTLCISFDKFIQAMFAADDFTSIIFDLTEAKSIDSTTLGLMAKISMGADERKDFRPIIISSSPGINRLLDTMGFDEIFDIIDRPLQPLAEAVSLDHEDVSEDSVRRKVLESHRILMDLNSRNADTFRDLVATLEQEE